MGAKLDSVMETDQGTQFVDDIGTAAITRVEIVLNIKAVFEGKKKVRLKLTTEKCQFGTREVVFVFGTIIPDGIASLTHRI